MIRLKQQHVSGHQGQKSGKGLLQFMFVHALGQACPPVGEQDADQTDAHESGPVHISPGLWARWASQGQSNSTDQLCAHAVLQDLALAPRRGGGAGAVSFFNFTESAV